MGGQRQPETEVAASSPEQTQVAQAEQPDPFRDVRGTLDRGDSHIATDTDIALAFRSGARNQDGSELRPDQVTDFLLNVRKAGRDGQLTSKGIEADAEPMARDAIIRAGYKPADDPSLYGNDRGAYIRGVRDYRNAVRAAGAAISAQSAYVVPGADANSGPNIKFTKAAEGGLSQDARKILADAKQAGREAIIPISGKTTATGSFADLVTSNPDYTRQRQQEYRDIIESWRHMQSGGQYPGREFGPAVPGWLPPADIRTGEGVNPIGVRQGDPLAKPDSFMDKATNALKDYWPQVAGLAAYAFKAARVGTMLTPAGAAIGLGTMLAGEVIQRALGINDSTPQPQSFRPVASGRPTEVSDPGRYLADSRQYTDGRGRQLGAYDTPPRDQVAQRFRDIVAQETKPVEQLGGFWYNRAATAEDVAKRVNDSMNAYRGRDSADQRTRGYEAVASADGRSVALIDRNKPEGSRERVIERVDITRANERRESRDVLANADRRIGEAVEPLANGIRTAGRTSDSSNERAIFNDREKGIAAAYFAARRAGDQAGNPVSPEKVAEIVSAKLATPDSRLPDGSRYRVDVADGNFRLIDTGSDGRSSRVVDRKSVEQLRQQYERIDSLRYSESGYIGNFGARPGIVAAADEIARTVKSQSFGSAEDRNRQVARQFVDGISNVSRVGSIGGEEVTPRRVADTFNEALRTARGGGDRNSLHAVPGDASRPDSVILKNGRGQEIASAYVGRDHSNQLRTQANETAKSIYDSRGDEGARNAFLDSAKGINALYAEARRQNIGLDKIGPTVNGELQARGSQYRVHFDANAAGGGAFSLTDRAGTRIVDGTRVTVDELRRPYDDSRTRQSDTKGIAGAAATLLNIEQDRYAYSGGRDGIRARNEALSAKFSEAMLYDAGKFGTNTYPSADELARQMNSSLEAAHREQRLSGRPNLKAEPSQDGNSVTLKDKDGKVISSVFTGSAIRRHITTVADSTITTAATLAGSINEQMAKIKGTNVTEAAAASIAQSAVEQLQRILPSRGLDTVGGWRDRLVSGRSEYAVPRALYNGVQSEFQRSGSSRNRSGDFVRPAGSYYLALPAATSDGWNLGNTGQIKLMRAGDSYPIKTVSLKWRIRD